MVEWFHGRMMDDRTGWRSFRSGSAKDKDMTWDMGYGISDHKAKIPLALRCVALRGWVSLAWRGIAWLSVGANGMGANGARVS